MCELSYKYVSQVCAFPFNIIIHNSSAYLRKKAINICAHVWTKRSLAGKILRGVVKFTSARMEAYVQSDSRHKLAHTSAHCRQYTMAT
jgi:hypothetical protein